MHKRWAGSRDLPWETRGPECRGKGRDGREPGRRHAGLGASLEAGFRPQAWEPPGPSRACSAGRSPGAAGRGRGRGFLGRLQLCSQPAEPSPPSSGSAVNPRFEVCPRRGGPALAEPFSASGSLRFPPLHPVRECPPCRGRPRPRVSRSSEASPSPRWERGGASGSRGFPGLASGAGPPALRRTQTV